MQRPYDDAIKSLFEASVQDFVDLLPLQMSVEGFLPVDMFNHIHIDELVRCRDAQGHIILAHFEFQPWANRRMGERLLEYNLLASSHNAYLPVHSCVIYLQSSKGGPRSPFIRTLPDGTVTTCFHYTSIELATIPTAEWLATCRPGLLPLLPLTKGGQTRETVQTMVSELKKQGRSRLIEIGLELAEEALTQQSDLEWLSRQQTWSPSF